MQNMNAPALKAFYQNKGYGLVQAVEVTRLNAEMIRTQVDAYTQPILDEMGLKDKKGVVITSLRRTFVCPDEVACAAFFAACDKANAENGFNLEAGWCPALIAENTATEAEHALINAAAKHFGVPFGNLYGEKRAELLKLLTLKGC